MKQNSPMPSLLPYVEPGRTGFRIDLTGKGQFNPAVNVNRRYPFHVLNDSSLLTRLLRADIVSTGGSRVQPVFLLVQKDHYRFQKGELHPLTNPDIEASWQEAHLFYSSSQAAESCPDAFGQSVIRLEKTDGDGNHRLAFEPLFFCSHRNLFFPPPCPGCGRTLVLCKDDNLLAQQGLESYTSSPRRYLHCSSCPPAVEGSGFFSLTLDISDPPGVQDGGGLVVAWRRLLASGVPLNEFPCTVCPEKDDCYGMNQLSTVRIVPFGFYPFHMLVFNAMTLHAADFLALISGANVEELETHLRSKNVPARLEYLLEQKKRFSGGDLFLFAGTDRQFLEVLYLKLSFLTEIAACINTRQVPPDINAALESLWVKIPVSNRLLPALWNFTASYIDIGLTDRLSTALSVLHAGQGTYFLGVLWFYVLLANRMQSVADIMAALSEMLPFSHEADFPPQKTLSAKNASVLSPENIFWSPKVHSKGQLPSEWRAFWEKSLQLGWSLLTFGRQNASEAFLAGLRQTIETLRTEIKRQLFTVSTAPIPREALPGEDQAIYKILLNVMNQANAVEKTASFAPSSMDEPETETVILRTPSVNDPHSKKPDPLSDPIEELAETVVLPKGATAPSNTGETGIPAGIPHEEALVETVVLSPLHHHHQTADGAAPAQNELPETVILSPGVLPGRIASRPAPPFEVKSSVPVDDDDVLSETVILRPTQK